MASRELLTSRASDNPERSVVVIDEVQRVPELLSVVHLLIENTTRVRPEDLRGLDSFGAGYPQAALLLLYRVTSRERRGRIWVVPVEDFLKDLAGASVAMHSGAACGPRRRPRSRDSQQRHRVRVLLGLPGR